MLFWVDFCLPKALLVSCASVSRYVSPRQWPLSADNGQREQCRRRAGLEEGQSAFRIPWPSGCCREGPAVTRAALLKGTIYRTRSPGKMDAWAARNWGAARCRLTPVTRRVGLPGAPAAPASAVQTLFNDNTGTPKVERGLLCPRTVLPAVPSPGPPLAGSPEKKGLIHPLRWKLAFSGGKLCNRFVVESAAVLKVFWKKKNR